MSVEEFILMINKKGLPAINFQQHNIRDFRKYLYELRREGLTPKQITKTLANICNNYVSPEAKYSIEDFAFQYLTEIEKYSQREAATEIMEAFMAVIEERGTDLIGTYDDVQYFYIRDMNPNLQANTVEYVSRIISSLPEIVRKTIKRVVFYDVASPEDKYWQVEYNEEKERFISTAAGGLEQIDLYMTTKPYSPQTFFHESGHCFDINHILSESEEYAQAVRNDYMLTGKKAVSDYGECSIWEDFADSFAEFMLGRLEQFPNRKQYFQTVVKYVSKDDNSLEAISSNPDLDVIDTLNSLVIIIDGIKKEEKNYGLKCLKAYATTGNINYIPREFWPIISQISIDDARDYIELVEFDPKAEAANFTATNRR